MRKAWSDTGCRKVDYINAHGTSTKVGDVVEVDAIRKIFGEGSVPPISSTKSLTGHSLGAAGVHEAIYSILMMDGRFIAGSANVQNLDERINLGEIAVDAIEDVDIDTALSNSFGFGGTNATLALSSVDG